MRINLLKFVIVVCLALNWASAMQAQVSSPVVVKGVAVTSGNAHDVLGDGTVSYDFESKTLTLNNATVVDVSESACLYFASSEPHTLRLKGSNLLVDFASTLLTANCSLTISGHGSLICSGYAESSCIWMRGKGATLTIQDCDLMAMGWNGIVGVKDSETSEYSAKLIMRNANVRSVGHLVQGYSGYAMHAFANITFDGCKIVKPVDAFFYKSLHGIALGDDLCEEVVISTGTSAVPFISSDRASVANRYDLSGRQVYDSFEGISIEQMNNGATRKVIRQK